MSKRRRDPEADAHRTPARREFMRRCAALSAAAFTSGVERFVRLTEVAHAQAPGDYKALVAIFMDGGNDGNNTVVPLDAAGYAAYSAVRAPAGLALAQGTLLPVTPPSIGQPFGLHPSLAGLHALWGQQKVAVVANVGPLVQPLTRAQYRSGVGRPQLLFSHSDQVATWQTSRGDTRSPTGWGGRVADEVRDMNPSGAFPVVTSLTGTQVFGLGVNTRPLAVSAAPTPLNQLLVLNGFNTSAEATARRTAMNDIRGMDRNLVIVDGASDATQQALDISAAFANDPVIATVFPNTNIGNQLKQVAKLIKLNQTTPALGLRRQMFFCKFGGFDTHSNQPDGQVSLLGDVSQAMTAFYNATVEMGLAPQVTAFTLSDFGRTLSPSGSGTGVGTDHAWGSHHFVVGGAVRGGEFYGVPGSNGTVFPTLTLSGPDDTDSRGRWIPTASVDQYAATLAQWFGVTVAELPTAFPLLGRFASNNLGFML
ncbi:MAG TPA: DUF1501 domain-containing protein [Vicinamibacteria bacterium]